MSFRKEKKFKLTKFEFLNLKNHMLKKGMIKLHNQRLVNSLYYDNEYYDMFQQSEEGTLPRKKIRIRWYDLISRANIEKKISSLEGRFKTSHKIHNNSLHTLPKIINDDIYGILTPSLLVSYNREYYSYDGNRLTFDSKIRYRNFRQSSIFEFKDYEQVMEIKVSLDTSDDYIESILPYSTSRFSKYSRGILISQGHL